MFSFVSLTILKGAPEDAKKKWQAFKVAFVWLKIHTHTMEEENFVVKKNQFFYVRC